MIFSLLIIDGICFNDPVPNDTVVLKNNSSNDIVLLLIVKLILKRGFLLIVWTWKYLVLKFLP